MYLAGWDFSSGKYRCPKRSMANTYGCPKKICQTKNTRVYKLKISCLQTKNKQLMALVAGLHDQLKKKINNNYGVIGETVD